MITLIVNFFFLFFFLLNGNLFIMPHEFQQSAFKYVVVGGDANDLICLTTVSWPPRTVCLFIERLIFNDDINAALMSWSRFRVLLYVVDR